ncbi:MAG: hypothetical protein P4L56_11545 [Candidatus Sulfopaludibacter sp.]|nr:hypothetical protein [Candidatus Sulfopaludibacter sp.]
MKLNDFDAGWPGVVIFGIMAAFVFGLTQTGQQLRCELGEYFVPPKQVHVIGPARTQVLVVTGNRSDQARIAMTMNPRGYRLLIAETKATAQQLARSAQKDICLIVVDSDLPQSKTIAASLLSIVPGAKIITLPHHPDSTELAVLLLGAI